MQGGIVGTEGVIGAQRQGAFERGLVDVYRDDRDAAGQLGQLHQVRAHAADAPDADGVAEVHLGGADDCSERRRDRVGQQRGLFERDVVGNTGAADRTGHDVLGPAAVVGEGHQVQVQAGGEVATLAVAALQAGTPC
ncbi:hypothetical protein SDC9_171686 [bioreactor metagenome]|uniref:Uncharacterized protein n=1 Tax=bioreactor metagenome TaxID=1076179 RepID=A0A645GBL9_9ZZZZ